MVTKMTETRKNPPVKLDSKTNREQEEQERRHTQHHKKPLLWECL